MVVKEAELHSYEIELELVPDLKKGSIFFLLAVDIGLLPSQSGVAVEQQTSHANLNKRVKKKRKQREKEKRKSTDKLRLSEETRDQRPNKSVGKIVCDLRML